MPASPLLLEPALSRAGTPPFPPAGRHHRALHCSPQFSPPLYTSVCVCLPRLPPPSLLLQGGDLIPVVAKKGKEMREGVEKKLEPVLPATAGGGGEGGCTCESCWEQRRFRQV